MRWPLIAVALTALASMAVGAPVQRAPRIELVDGTLALESSLPDQAIFSADDLAPGQSTSGTLTLSNTGTLAGALTLEQSDPDPAGAALAQELQLTIEDLTGTPATAYAGPLSGLDSLALGTLGPGAARTYRLSASLPTSAGDAVAGASMSVAYTWTATEVAEPPPPAEPPAPDEPEPPKRLREPLGVDVRVPPRQRLAASGRLVVYVRCSRACSLVGQARLRAGRHRLSSRRVRLARVQPRRRVRLVLAMSRRACRILRQHGSRRATVTVTARTASGARRTVRKRARIAAAPARR